MPVALNQIWMLRIVSCVSHAEARTIKSLCGNLGHFKWSCRGGACHCASKFRTFRGLFGAVVDFVVRLGKAKADRCRCNHTLDEVYSSFSKRIWTFSRLPISVTAAGHEVGGRCRRRWRKSLWHEIWDDAETPEPIASPTTGYGKFLSLGSGDGVMWAEIEGRLLSPRLQGDWPSLEQAPPTSSITLLYG